MILSSSSFRDSVSSSLRLASLLRSLGRRGQGREKVRGGGGGEGAEKEREGAGRKRQEGRGGREGEERITNMLMNYLLKI